MSWLKPSSERTKDAEQVDDSGSEASRWLRPLRENPEDKPRPAAAPFQDRHSDGPFVDFKSGISGVRSRDFPKILMKKGLQRLHCGSALPDMKMRAWQGPKGLLSLLKALVFLRHNRRREVLKPY